MQAGDEVQLKSGGPVMTIRWVEGTKTFCEWFDGAAVKRDEFLVTSLKEFVRSGGTVRDRLLRAHQG